MYQYTVKHSNIFVKAPLLKAILRSSQSYTNVKRFSIKLRTKGTPGQLNLCTNIVSNIILPLQLLGLLSFGFAYFFQLWKVTVYCIERPALKFSSGGFMTGK